MAKIQCPYCYSDEVKKVEQDKFGDLFFCLRCEHKFRYDAENVNQTIKSLEEEQKTEGMQDTEDVFVPKSLDEKPLPSEQY